MSISPNVPSPQESYQYESTGTPRWIAVLFGVVIAALPGLGYAGYSTQSRLSQDLAKQQDQNKILTAQLDQANSRIAVLKSKMEVTTQRVGLTQSGPAQPQPGGPVQVTLNKTDPKKAKYTLTVVADDKTIEKKDKTSGEPVQFYVKGSARMAPYEIVVFDVGKNQITGYLATPKEGGAGAPPAAAATPAPAAVSTKP